MTRLPDHDAFRSCAECGLCNNKYDPRQPIAGVGPVPASIMFIGQAPGKVEQRVGVPFQGPAGRELDAVIAESGLSRDEIYITNVVKQRPDDGGKDRKPKYAEMAACIRWLYEEVTTVQPRVVVLFGETAQQLAFPGLRPAQAQGLVRVKHNIVWLATYHPAWILYKRDPNLRGYLTDTVRRAAHLAERYDRILPPADEGLELMPGVLHEAAS